MSKRDLLQQATELIRKGHDGSYWAELGRKHGPTGAILGALIDIFAAGGRKELGDIGKSRQQIAKAGLRLTPNGVLKVPNLPTTYVPPPPYKPPSVWSTIPLPKTYEPRVPADGRFRVGTIPQPLEPQVPHQPGRVIITPSAPPNRSAAAPGTVEKRVIGGTRQKPVEYVPDTAYNDYTLGGLMTFPDDEDNFWDSEILTPESSNVYSFAYDKRRGILYVTFRAPGEAISMVRGTNTCTGEEYSYGVRPNERGPMYAYGSAARPIPETLYNEMVSATSKGRFVWDRLRVCGSVWQHQYPYALVSPSMAGEMYVPRKATKLGFRVRAVPTVGKGRRSVVWSTLQEQPYAGTDPAAWRGAKSGWWHSGR